MKIKYKINTVHFSIGMNKYRHSWPACRLLQQGINILIIANYIIFKKIVSSKDSGDFLCK